MLLARNPFLQGARPPHLQEIDDDVREAFEQVDKDGNGSIDLIEFRRLMRSLGDTHAPAEVEAFFDTIDASEDGLIALEEFSEWWASEPRTRINPAVRVAFDEIDKDESGTIDLSTLVKDGSADGWDLRSATDINEDGWIVGNGIRNGESRAFLLIPREPCAGDTNRDGQVTPADFSAWVSAFNSGCD